MTTKKETQKKDIVNEYAGLDAAGKIHVPPMPEIPLMLAVEDRAAHLELRDYFAAQAMLAVMQETQEMRVGTFWDWCKSLMVTFLNFSFLSVKYVKVDNVYEDAAKRAYEYADALLAARADK